MPIVEMRNIGSLHRKTRGSFVRKPSAFQSTFRGLFSEINLSSEKLGKTLPDRNAALSKIITEIARRLREFSTNTETLGDAYEYLVGQFGRFG